MDRQNAAYRIQGHTIVKPSTTDSAIGVRCMSSIVVFQGELSVVLLVAFQTVKRRRMFCRHVLLRSIKLDSIKGAEEDLPRCKQSRSQTCDHRVSKRDVGYCLSEGVAARPL